MRVWVRLMQRTGVLGGAGMSR
eukprot:COSAG05_NODE_20496_length_279_cov_0.566667_1_plen_21_part_01